MKIFGVKIEKYEKKIVLKECLKTLVLPFKKTLFIANLNPEILLTTKKNKDYKKIINSADIKIVDGFGLEIISWLKKEQIGVRITGAHLSKLLIEKAKKNNLKIGIIYLEDGWSSKSDLEKIFKSQKIQLLKVTKKDYLKKDYREMQNRDLVLVAIGHPRQEILIYQKILKLKGVKIAMGIGGTLDYWTKKKKRAPQIFQKIGLEWLWRFIIQPNRILRIFNAVIKFPILALLNK